MRTLGDTGRKVCSVAFISVSAAIFLIGCASQQRPDAQAKEDKAAVEAAKKDIGSIDDAKCQSFGVPGSPSYVQCRNDLANTRNRMGIKE